MEEGKYISKLADEELFKFLNDNGLYIHLIENASNGETYPDIERKNETVYMVVVSYDKRRFCGITDIEFINLYLSRFPEAINKFDMSVLCVKDYGVELMTHCKYLDEKKLNNRYLKFMSYKFGSEYVNDCRRFVKESKLANKRKVTYEEGVGFEPER